MRIQHSTRLFIGALVVAGTAAAQDFSLQVSTDSMEPVPLSIAEVDTGRGLFQLNGDFTGTSGFVPADLTSPMVVRIEETPLVSEGRNAVTLGQHFTYLPASVTDGADLTLSYFQPTARQVTFSTPAGLAVSDETTGWVAYADPGSAPLTFDAYVAELPTREVFSNYAAFKIGSHVDLFEHGLVLRVDEAVDLGDGIVIRIDSETYEYPAAASAHAFWMETPTLTSAFTAQVLLVDPDGYIHVGLSGTLLPGDNVIGLLSANPGSMYPAAGFPDGPLQSVGNGGQCTPPAPTCTLPAGQCNPPAPSGAAWSWPKSCAHTSLKIGGLVCADPGSEMSDEQCTEWKGGVGITVNLKAGPVGIKMDAKGEVSGSECSIVTALAGHCAQAYRCINKCSKRWECTRLAWHGFSAVNWFETTHCMVKGPKVSKSCQY